MDDRLITSSMIVEDEPMEYSLRPGFCGSISASAM